MHFHLHEMIADFREVYHLRLLDVLDGTLSVAEAAILTEQLPPSSRTFAARQGGAEYWGWTLDRHLTAALVDAVRENTFAFIQSNTKKKLRNPQPIPRPGDEERKQQEKQNNPFALMVKAQMSKLRESEQKTKIVIPDE